MNNDARVAAGRHHTSFATDDAAVRERSAWWPVLGDVTLAMLSAALLCWLTG